jgi:deazaflavin-dependent oxidoreductase (nitroreductase family)
MQSSFTFKAKLLSWLMLPKGTSMTEQRPATPPSFNQQIITEFRANGGLVGGMFQGAPLVLLTTAGARTGKPHTNPAVYLRDGARILVFASNAGQSKNPDWYHNILADPQVTVEIGQDGRVKTYAARGLPLDGAERDRFYQIQAQLNPAFRDYQARTSRVIPVIALYPLDLAADPARNRAIGEQLVRHHNELRRQLLRLRSEVDEFVAGHPVPPGTRQPAPTLDHELLRHCLTFCDGLGMHHIREDGAFSAFETRFPELVPVLDRLRQEHRLVAQTLTDLHKLVEGLTTDPDPAEIGRLHTELERLATGLEEHFNYEEQQLLPALSATI